MYINIYIYIYKYCVYIYIYIYIYICFIALLENSLPSVYTLQPTRSLHLDFALVCATIGSCLQ